MAVFSMTHAADELGPDHSFCPSRPDAGTFVSLWRGGKGGLRSAQDTRL